MDTFHESRQSTPACGEKTSKKIALVTGSATGIGANIAIDLAASGYTVIVTGRNLKKLKQVVANCNLASERSTDRDACLFVADLLDLKQIDELINFIKLTFGRLDVLVNNACWRGDFHDILHPGAVDELKKVLHINVSVPMYLIHKCVIPLRLNNPKMNDNRSTNQNDSTTIIMNISSVASQLVVPLHLYSISKACLSELSRQIALVSHETNILSLTISPGPVLTDERPHHKAMSNMTLMNRVATTQEISNLALFAIKHAKLFNGKELNADGGYAARQMQTS